MLQGLHNVPKATSSFDKVKKSFADSLISSPAADRVLTSSSTSESVKQNSNNHDDANRIFNPIGWALPKQSSFCFSQNRKMFLFKVFGAGKKLVTKAFMKEFTS